MAKIGNADLKHVKKHIEDALLLVEAASRSEYEDTIDRHLRVAITELRRVNQELEGYTNV